VDFPVYIRIGPYALHPHSVFEALAYAIAFLAYLFLRRRREDTIGSDQRLWVVTAAFVGGAIGSRFLYLLEDPVSSWTHWNDFTYLFGGKSIIGGLIGGLVAVEWIKPRIRVRQSTGDLFAIPLALGIATGRVGCFLTGLADRTYGTATTLAWGVDFNDGIYRHPAPLYEIVFLVPLAYFLWRRMEPNFNGDVFRLFMVSYMGWRLAIDFLKPGLAFAGLTTLQWACVGVLAYYHDFILRTVAVAWAVLTSPRKRRVSIP
jgi:prolipoprotein diacylglyceryltransferase